MDYMNKLITLSTGIQYVILDNTKYAGKDYVLANEVENGNLGSIVTLFKIEQSDDCTKFIEEDDLSVTESVLAKMSH